MGRVIAIVNQKGGVGKTTTAVNLSAGLALGGHSVLLIDADAQCSATSGYGIRLAEEEPSTYDVILGHASPADAARTTMLPSLRVIGASRDLVGAEIELVSVEQRERRLRNALATVRDQYEYILIDCPPSLGLVTLNALTGCDSLLIPLQCEYYALEGLSDLVGTLRKVKQNLNPAIEIEALVRTMYDPRSTLTVQVSDELKRHYGAKVFDTVIPRNVRIAEAPSFGKPVLLHDPASRGASAHLAFARELLERSGHPVAAGA